MAISPECFVCFRWDLQIWKDHPFNLTTGMEGIAQLLRSNFEQSKSKWRYHDFAKKGTFFEHVRFIKLAFYMPWKTPQWIIIYSNTQRVFNFLDKNAYLRGFNFSRTKVLCYFHFPRIFSDGKGAFAVTIH